MMSDGKTPKPPVPGIGNLARRFGSQNIVVREIVPGFVTPSKASMGRVATQEKASGKPRAEVVAAVKDAIAKIEAKPARVAKKHGAETKAETHSKTKKTAKLKGYPF